MVIAYNMENAAELTYYKFYANGLQRPVFQKTIIAIFVRESPYFKPQDYNIMEVFLQTVCIRTINFY